MYFVFPFSWSVSVANCEKTIDHLTLYSLQMVNEMNENSPIHLLMTHISTATWSLGFKARDRLIFTGQYVTALTPGCTLRARDAARRRVGVAVEYQRVPT